MTFGTLQTTVKNYLGVSNLDTMIPTFINIAKRKIERENNFKWMENYWYDPNTGYLKLSSDSITLPDNLKGIKYVRVWWSGGGSHNVPIIDFNDLQNKYPDDNWDDHLAPGQPKEACAVSWADWALVFKPYPDNLSYYYNVDLVYYVYSDDLAADADDTYWTSYCWEALLYGALLEGASYLVNDPRLPIWQQKYAEAIASLRKQDTDLGLSANMNASSNNISLEDL